MATRFSSFLSEHCSQKKHSRSYHYNHLERENETQMDQSRVICELVNYQYGLLPQPFKRAEKKKTVQLCWPIEI